MEDAELKITSSIDEVLRVLDSWGACQVAELLRVRHRKLLDNSYSIDDLIYIRDMCQHPRGLKDIWIETISSDDWLNMLDEVVFLIDDFIENVKK